MAKQVLSGGDNKDDGEKQAKSKAGLMFQRAVARMLETPELVRRVSAVDGVSINTLTNDLRDQIAEHEKLSDKGDKPYGWAFQIDVHAPEHEEGEEWTAIVKAADGSLQAVPFKITDGHAKLSGEPAPVQHSNKYDFIEEDDGEPEPTKKGGARHIPSLFYRFVKAESVDTDADRFQVAFASETPFLRTAKKGREDKIGGMAPGTEYYEVLSHAKGDYDFSGLNNSGALLDEHYTTAHIGKVHRAMVSKDKMSRAAISFDEASELSKTRKKQFISNSRPHLSVGYVHTKYLGEEKRGDLTVKRFAWAADEISSVACPADPHAGKNRSKEGVYSRADDDEMAHCLRCGEEFPRSELDDDFMCDDCLAANRAKGELQTRSASQIDSKPQTEDKRMPETVTLTEADVLTRSNAAAQSREKDLLARNKDFAEMVDGHIANHGLKKRKSDGKLGADVLRGIANEFCQRDSTTPTAQLKLELGQKCLTEIAGLENPQYPGAVVRMGRSGARDMAGYSFLRACSKLAAKKEQGPPPDGLERECHDDILRFVRENNQNIPHDPTGFLVPEDAPGRANRAQYDRIMGGPGRFSRDLYTGGFGQGGALVPTDMLVPMIELLRNRLVLAWAGCTPLGGLTSNVVIPRQTSACAPQAVAELAQLANTNQTFDQISLSPHRVGNPQFYSRLLVIQAAPDFEAIIREDNFRQMATVIDELGLNGVGGAQPLGILETPGINSVTFGATVTLANAILMRTLIRQANVNDPLSYVTTSSSSGRMMAAPAALIGSQVVSGQTNAIWVGDELDGKVAGVRAFASQQVPNNIMLCGAFEHCILANFGGLNVVMDYVTKAANDEIGIIINTYIDVALRHAVAFTASTDAANQ